MNILYTCDNNYVWLMGISMISLFKTNSKAKEINVFLIGENISKENKKLLDKIANDYNRTCKIVDLPDIKMTSELYSDRWPRSAFSRLFCGEILPKTIKKILYIDCDTIIKDNLEKFYNNKKSEKYAICGVKDCVSGNYKKNIGLSKDSAYINAGVLLINIDLLRKRKIFEEINDFVDKYNKHINYADQDILNYLFKDEIGILDLNFNVRTLEFVYKYKDILKLRRPNNYYNEDEINKATESPSIIHYTTNMTMIRPWFSNSNHPKKEEFLNIYKNQDYFKKDFQEFSTGSLKYRFFNFFLHLPKCIGYSSLGFIHSVLVPLLK